MLLKTTLMIDLMLTCSSLPLEAIPPLGNDDSCSTDTDSFNDLKGISGKYSDTVIDGFDDEQNFKEFEEAINNARPYDPFLDDCYLVLE